MLTNLKALCQKMGSTKDITTVAIAFLMLLDTVIPSEVTPPESSLQTDMAGVSKRLYRAFSPHTVWSSKNGRGLDKFRFFHMGLGKRSRTGQKRGFDMNRFFHVGLGKRNHPVDNTFIDDTYRDIGTTGNDVQDTFLDPWTTTEPLDSYLDRLIEQSSLYQLIKDADVYDGMKRAPEEFSEMLYPIQSGKQELEVMIDKSLDNNAQDEMDRFYDNNFDVESVDQIDLDSVNTHGNDEVDSLESESSLDPETTSLRHDVGDSKFDRTIIENANSMIPTNKRWIGNEFKKFRSPKSSRVLFRGRPRPFDPVYYFIGLGK